MMQTHMQLRRLSSLFTITGVAVGAIAILGYAFDLVPSLPPAVLKLVIYKLTFIGALGLVVFGALIGRIARRERLNGVQRDAPKDLLNEGSGALDASTRSRSEAEGVNG